MTENEQRLFQELINEYGVDAQVGMLYEECGELFAVLNKMNREDSGASRSALRGNVLAEIEDVRIRLDQLIMILKSTDEHTAYLREGGINKLRDALEVRRRYNREQDRKYNTPKCNKMKTAH